MNDLLGKIAEHFRHFPGIGPRQAKRFVYYLLHQGAGEIDGLIRNLEMLKRSVARCADCQRYFPLNGSGQKNLCQLCAETGRDQETILIVEKDVDLENVERSGTYSGRFFILGGLVPILEKAPLEKLNWRELVALLNRLQKSGKLKEIIIALTASVEGDHTAEYLETELHKIANFKDLKISVLGRGLSTGTELEYSDSSTLKNALANRRAL